MIAVKNYKTIQALRLVAAASVALTHVTFYIKSRIDPQMLIWDVGSQGVQIFFVISGFVMALSSGAVTNQVVDWREFMMKRLVRIVPLYWVMNLVKLLTLAVIPGVIFAKPDALNIILSMLFIPSKNEANIIETFYGVGWTLNFEMFFYLIIAACLIFKKPIIIISSALLSLFIFFSAFRQDDWPAISYFFHPYMANFIWGLLVAKLASKFEMNKPILGFVLVIVSSYFIFIDPIQPKMSLLGIQYGALVLGLIMLEFNLSGKIPKLMLFGGDASYSLYLTHAMSGPIAVIIASKIGIHSMTGALLFASAVILLVASATFLYIEKPIAKAISRRQRRTGGGG